MLSSRARLEKKGKPSSFAMHREYPAGRGIGEPTIEPCWRRGRDSNLSRIAGVSEAGVRWRNPEQCEGPQACWRRGWDLNPRYPLRYVRFRGGSFQPLTHLSASDKFFFVQSNAFYQVEYRAFARDWRDKSCSGLLHDHGVNKINHVGAAALG